MCVNEWLSKLEATEDVVFESDMEWHLLGIFTSCRQSDSDHWCRKIGEVGLWKNAGKTNW